MKKQRTAEQNERAKKTVGNIYFADRMLALSLTPGWAWVPLYVEMYGQALDELFARA